MKFGFLKTCAATPEIKLGNCEYNAQSIKKLMDQSSHEGAEVVVFPELCLTGATCGDLFFQNILISSANNELLSIIGHSIDLDPVYLIGVPLLKNGNLYNCAVLFQKGKVLGVTAKKPKTAERRFFSSADDNQDMKIKIGEAVVPFGNNLTFYASGDLPFTVEVLWGNSYIDGNAALYLQPAADYDVAGSAQKRIGNAKAFCGYHHCGLVYSGADMGESGTDFAYSGHRFICEDDVIVSSSEPFANGLIFGEIDIEKLLILKRKNNLPAKFSPVAIPFLVHNRKGEIERKIISDPFMPRENQAEFCENILEIQARGLARRLSHIGHTKAIIGLSGGLDSTMAITVIKRAFDILGLPHEGILAVTMPCFGTSGRTMQNAVKLARLMGAALIEIPIKDAVTAHFESIGQPIDKHDLTFENAQARERTQILMDLGNKENALVVGTGDLSEIALGWSTYNGDHMSMYSVNATVPKSVMRRVLSVVASKENDELKDIILDVIDTPVSPELLPTVEGQIAQITENIVGEYDLHDFFIYQVIGYGFSPKKVFHLACKAFENRYDGEYILKYLKLFYRRFFSQQFKRSCMPDGVTALPITLSPRGGLIMPSDSYSAAWLSELSDIEL